MFALPDSEHCNPATLAALVKLGDAEALDRITRCYGDRLMRAARQRCRSEVEAEDAVQDTLIIAAEQGSQFRGEGSLEGWLVRIVASACRRLGRGSKNDTALHDSEVDPISPDDSPETAASHREVAALLETALLALGPTDRLLLLLAEVEGTPGAEIARETGLSHDQVRTRLSRLRKRLREQLQSSTAQDADA
jgi:RNA polymerase sigma-70 factor, ECF subfamily